METAIMCFIAAAILANYLNHCYLRTRIEFLEKSDKRLRGIVECYHSEWDCIRHLIDDVEALKETAERKAG